MDRTNGQNPTNSFVLTAEERVVQHFRRLQFFVPNHMTKVNETALKRMVANLTSLELASLATTGLYHRYMDDPANVVLAQDFDRHLRLLGLLTMKSLGLVPTEEPDPGAADGPKLTGL